MHPGDHSGHVIDLGIEFSTGQLPIQDEIKTIDEQSHQSYQQVFKSHIFVNKERYFLLAIRNNQYEIKRY